jgi:hypothetical protein
MARINISVQAMISWDGGIFEWSFYIHEWRQWEGFYLVNPPK